MKYDHFIAHVRESIMKRENGEVQIRFCRITHNNGTYSNSICILRKEDNVSPAISLELFYEMACQGIPMEEVVDRIMHYYNHYRKNGRIDMSFFTDFARAGERIVCRVIHYRKNRKLLEDVPHRRFLDLAVVYYYLLEDEEFKDGSILIRNSHVELWGITKKTLWKKALDNMDRLLPFEFFTLSGLIEQLSGIQIPDVQSDCCPMYVLTNQRKTFGAACMVQERALEEAGERIGEDYYVLPASIHECILIPVSAFMSVEELQKMVQEINETQVEDGELLSNSVYCYHRSEKNLCIALEGASI